MLWLSTTAFLVARVAKSLCETIGVLWTLIVALLTIWYLPILSVHIYMCVYFVCFVPSWNVLFRFWQVCELSYLITVRLYVSMSVLTVDLELWDSSASSIVSNLRGRMSGKFSFVYQVCITRKTSPTPIIPTLSQRRKKVQTRRESLAGTPWSNRTTHTPQRTAYLSRLNVLIWNTYK